jgi:hypothetical protein
LGPFPRGPDEATLNRTYQLLADKVKQVEYLIGYEGDAALPPVAHTPINVVLKYF